MQSVRCAASSDSHVPQMRQPMRIVGRLPIGATAVVDFGRNPQREMHRSSESASQNPQLVAPSSQQARHAVHGHPLTVAVAVAAAPRATTPITLCPEDLQEKLVGLHSLSLELQTQISEFHRHLSLALVKVLHNRGTAQKRKRGIALCLRQLDSRQHGLDEALGELVSG